MGKRIYTHIQTLLPEIKAMLAEGKTQREVAEYYGFQDKQVVKRLLERERRKERKLEAGILPRPKGRPRKDSTPRDIVAEQAMRSSSCVWEIHCCGIFCTVQKGSEAKGKISHHISSQDRVSHGNHVQILCRIQKRLLRLWPSPWQAGEGRSSCKTHRTAVGTQLPHLRVQADVAMTEASGYFP